MAETVPDTHNRLDCLNVDIRHENGKIVLFPCYLHHEVLVHTDEQPRFSMSFNAILDEAPRHRAGLRRGVPSAGFLGTMEESEFSCPHLSGHGLSVCAGNCGGWIT